jgi:triacylglycerol lipase
MRRRALSLALCCAALCAAATPAAATPSLKYPPAGANDFSCKPTSAHPNPVILLHGLSATMGANWNYLSPLLKARGYCVYALTYGLHPGTEAPGGVIPIEQSAAELAPFVDRVLAQTGAKQADFVGHSEGTFMPQYYLKFLGGAAKVDRYVAFTPLYKGTKLAAADQIRDLGGDNPLSNAFIDFISAFCGSCPQFVAGSEMQKKLYAGGPAVPGVIYTTVITKNDELVQPYTSGLLDPPATNRILQDICPSDRSEHGAVAFDPVAAQLTFNALDPANAGPIDCSRLPPPSGGAACAASAKPPHAYVLRRTLKAGRRGLSIRGQAYSLCSGGPGLTDRTVERVSVALARYGAKGCAFLSSRGGFTRTRSCRRPLALNARGTGTWSFATKAKLPAGRYALYAFATGANGRREAQPARPNARTRVR